MATELRPIDSNRLKERVWASKDGNPHSDKKLRILWDHLHDQFATMVGFAPTIDAVEVVHGRWFFTEYEYFNCSVCGFGYYNGCECSSEAREKLKNGDTYRYCPNCGAKMDGERKDNG